MADSDGIHGALADKEKLKPIYNNLPTLGFL
jgi:hypothetical protein